MSNQIVVRGQLVNYLSSGEKNNATTALIFLHGWRSEAKVWQTVIQRIRELENENLSMFALDLPGFGRSPAPLKPFSIGDYAEIVKEFIEKMKLKNVIVVGHSFGGRVAIKLAAISPRLISKLVLVDSAGFAMNEDKKNILGTAAKIAKPFFKPKFMQSLRKKIYEQIGSEDYVATPELTQTYLKVISEDLTEDMKKIIQPTLIVYGQDDTVTPPEFGERMKGLIVGSKLTILPGAGHFSFLDKPKEFAVVLQNFI